jgi:hypothetical protein
MNTYRVNLNIEVEVVAFDETDAKDYVNDIFNVDDEIKSVNITKIQEI